MGLAAWGLHIRRLSLSSGLGKDTVLILIRGFRVATQQATRQGHAGGSIAIVTGSHGRNAGAGQWGEDPVTRHPFPETAMTNADCGVPRLQSSQFHKHIHVASVCQPSLAAWHGSFLYTHARLKVSWAGKEDRAWEAPFVFKGAGSFWGGFGACAPPHLALCRVDSQV